MTSLSIESSKDLCLSTYRLSALPDTHSLVLLCLPRAALSSAAHCVCCCLHLFLLTYFFPFLTLPCDS